MAAWPGGPARLRPARCLLLLAACCGAFALLARWVALPLLFWRLAERCERPAHEAVGSIQAEGPGGPLTVELRRYAPLLVAEVLLPRSLSAEQRQVLGFRQVAGYIFGGNRQRRRLGELGRWVPRWMAAGPEGPEKIAMTAPVVQQTDSAAGRGGGEEEAAGRIVKVSFTMPSKYSRLSELPVPTNRNVTLRAVPAHYAAVVGFRGRPPSAAKVASVQSAMEVALAAAGLRPEAGRGALVHQYHDPFATPRVLRWNEVVLLLEPEGVEARR
ncbi:unnamed protein product [Prorocentrum cordatum]|uniref:SOUL heme-binding protein n=1 Tax=Prorocentrum cordatum TaxID=2364126 RepID=A0ABN9SPN1_9DINO|nr:unnamed protein product [Polarella glacialis]